jgi:predicted flap endonuclease-1-like 5' DNA nuclease
MSERDEKLSCTLNCWIMGGLAGLVFAAVLWVVTAAFTPLQVVFTGLLIAVAVGLLLSLFVCGGRRTGPPQQMPRSAAPRAAAPEAADSTRSASAAAGAAAATHGVASVAAGTAAGAAVAPEPAPAEPAVKPSKELPGQRELAARKGTWRYEKEGQPSATEKAPEKTPEPDAEVPGAGQAAPSDESAPSLMQGPRGGSKDDLQRINGVGPKMEQTLNEMGIWHFDQIAAWGDREVAWVDNRLRFKGRIRRDDWIGQAKSLASGG